MTAVLRQTVAGMLGTEVELLAQSAAPGPDGQESAAWTLLCRTVPAAAGEEPRLALAVVRIEADRRVIPLDAEVWPLTDGDGAAAVPDAETLLTLFFLPIAELPEGTAGASLRRAGLVHDVWLLCAGYDFASPDAESARSVLQEARDALPEEDRARYDEQAPAVLAEVRRLLDPRETMDGVYGDAGVADSLAVLRGEESVCRSAACFLNLLP